MKAERRLKQAVLLGRPEPGQQAGALTECIRILREFDPSRPVGELKQRLTKQEAVVTLVPYETDISDELQGRDPIRDFRELVRKLEQAGAAVIPCEDGRPVPRKFLDNRLCTLDEIRLESLLDCARESEDS